ncbi:MAG: FAD-binding oxidoreductase [Proteobacteria bacterium]|nr:FAD-binding oxidoreductase [Pseudomonadota bacterium]
MSIAPDCQSYYTATINEPTSYPRLQGDEVADICIIGGGYTGLSSALRLAERGYAVALLESFNIGWGASGRNGGQLLNGLGGRPALRKKYGADIEAFIDRLCWRGNEIVEENIKKYDIECDLKYGHIDCAFKDRQMRDLETEFERFSSLGMGDRFRMVGADEINEHVGTRAYKGGLYNDRDGHLHPLNLCLGEARAATGLGVKIYEQSPVTSIAHGKEPVVHTEHGSVRAKMVILAGNAYHLLEQKQVGGVLFPAGTFIIATEPLDDAMASNVMPSDAAACDVNEMLDYYRLSADKRMLYGGRCNYSGRDPKDIKAAILPRMLRVFPQLKDARIDFQWGGKIGIVINRVPQLGRIGDNVYYAQGYSGHGINQTHIVGEILTDAICGQMEDFDVFAKVKHWKIPAPRWVGNNMVALGMLYYRMKDLL